MRCAGHVACMREKRNKDTDIVSNFEGRIPFGRRRRRRGDNIKMDLK
jgi:hypothetical protein